jgi:hypothetical protein
VDGQQVEGGGPCRAAEGVCVGEVGAGLQVPAGHPSPGGSWRNAEKRRAPGALPLGERQWVLLGRPSSVFGTFTPPPPRALCSWALGSA